MSLWGNPIVDMKEMFTELRQWATDQGATIDVVGFGVTGYAGDVMEKALLADYASDEKEGEDKKKESLRKFFMALQQSFIDWNNVKRDDPAYKAGKDDLIARIDAASAAK